jgi:hypothetical protein
VVGMPRAVSGRSGPSCRAIAAPPADSSTGTPVCMYVCMLECMYVCMNECDVYVCINGLYVCMYLGICVYVCM